MGVSTKQSVRPVVVVVDDNAEIRDSVDLLLTSIDYLVLAFPNAEAFLDAALPPHVGCAIVDVRMPGRSGLDLQAHLNDVGVRLPIIFVTGFADVPMTVRAMKAGAVDVLSKPFREQDLLDAVRRAIQTGEAWRREAETVSDLRQRYETLTPREREILCRVAAGRINKQIAFEMGVTEITVKVHRSQVMRKMRARSLADLVRMADYIAPSIGQSWAAYRPGLTPEPRASVHLGPTELQTGSAR